jgi:hypothetical protein
VGYTNGWHMDFIDEVKALAARVPGLLGHIVTDWRLD